ncbi:MAG TPA: T6SS immunity protein Tdi1 domain-containing protein [Candidatus Limnocylindrales bacterium]|nr:T6SS immunity protein Tdi1 domain-containing protein [Candidatus Limnocylindrales bacterium]
MSDLLKAISEGWSWKVGKPIEVVDTNKFGNAIVKNQAGQYFRIIPEEWECDLLAISAADLENKRKREDFIRDWEMLPLVARAEAAHGPLTEGQVYSLVIPGLLGGKYTEDNIRKTGLLELLSYCGDMAHQMEDVPDGAQIKLVLKK